MHDLSCRSRGLMGERAMNEAAVALPEAAD